MNAQKEEYVKISKLIDLPVFYSPWWLDMVCTDGEWNGIVSYDKENNIRGVFTYFIKKAFPGYLIKMPPLTPQMGPLPIHNNAVVSWENCPEFNRAQDDFLSRLPKTVFFRQRHHPWVTNWLPYCWSGFRQTSRFTYHLDLSIDYDQIFNSFKSNIRSDIRKAQKKLQLVDSGNPELLNKLIQTSFSNKKIRDTYSQPLINKVLHECSLRKCAKVLYAVDSAENVHASVLMVWDSKAAYYLIGTTNPEFKGSGASSFLIWNAMQLPEIKGKIFDFEGSMIQPVEKYFRAFGGKLIPYNEIIRHPLINKLKALL